MMKENNIILNQYDSSSIKEINPSFVTEKERYNLSYVNGRVVWNPQYRFVSGKNTFVNEEDFRVSIDASVDTRVIIEDKLRDTDMFYKEGRMGLGRSPLHSYKFDIGVPENTLMTAFHVGDGKYGFSMGNGTQQGFIPEIIGMGSDENDAGLYFLGRAGNNNPSQIPLIIIDGRNYLHEPLINRPIFGVTNAQYDKYQFLIDNDGTVHVSGKIHARDVIIDPSISTIDLIDIIIEQKEQINKLNDRVRALEEALK